MPGKAQARQDRDSVVGEIHSSAHLEEVAAEEAEGEERLHQDLPRRSVQHQRRVRTDPPLPGLGCHPDYRSPTAVAGRS